ncbi:C-terminal binding protein [Rhodococcus opacus]|uniref:C-terminal binding protein n=1 Tax=Rhodococcus opacus TaxID=37919 RepID=UPI002949BD9D|nr:C-terminal binding protein [Rhodococcus opacus]MDV6244889.1 C-terminal binding protein [Rhodococcus opacus]
MVLDHPFASVDPERSVAETQGASFAEFQCVTREQVSEAASGASVVLVNKAPVTRSVLSQLAPSATVIRYGVGTDNIDLDAAQKLGVQVANVPDYGTSTVAEHTCSAILSLLRRLPMFDTLVRERGWFDPVEMAPLRDFSETTIGLVGLGRIGQAVQARLAAFGFDFLAYDPRADRDAAARNGIRLVDLPELLSTAHAVSLHAPLTPVTHHLISSTAIALMRPDMVLVNTSRGGLVDADALAAALRSGRLAGAALDVFEEEPLPYDAALRTVPNVVLSPHAAYYSDQAFDRLHRLAVEETARALRGVPLRCPVVASA